MSSHASNSPPIAIIGAGPSGLTLARLLEVKNIPYIVFDRDVSPDAARGGGSLDLGPGSGQMALSEAGLFDKFKPLARYQDQAFRILDKQADLVWAKPNEESDDRPEIDRKALRRMLLESIPQERVKWDARVKSLKREADSSMAVQLANGNVETGFKLVVGADGGWSKARDMITPVKPRYTGLCYLQGNIHTTNEFHSTVCSRVGPGAYMALGDGNNLYVQRQGNGSYQIFAGGRFPEGWWRTNQERFRSLQFREQLIADRYSDWSSQITDLIRYSDGFDYVWALYETPSESVPWEHVPGVTLVGDAAHLTGPNGEGVNIALYDSLQLAQEIEQAGVGNLDDAVRKYEKKMFPRALEHIAAGEEGVRMFFAEDAAENFKNNAGAIFESGEV
ncbi:hypothetical protein LTR08_000871 [Meristemomyces frigidus]|nr:hypothetical protein LTR08_000871 [Meristemomyces frigidus]